MLEADKLQEATEMIEIIGPALSQWDVGRSVKVTNIEADHFHFANKGDLKAVVIKIADTQIKIPDYLLQTGKQLCVYAVKDGITVESKIFYVMGRERPENYVYEDDQRNYIYELISNAEKAAESANLAAESANTSVVNADAATENANKAAASANEASKNANEAAAKAAHTAKSLMVVGKEEGANIYLDDAIEQYLVGCRIFGKTTQIATTGAQLIPMPYKTNGMTSGGVVYEEQSDGGVKCAGISTSGAYYPLYGGFAVEKFPIPEWLVEGETYTISGGTNDIAVLLVLYKEDETAKQYGGTPQLTFVMPSGYTYCGIFLRCSTGKTVSAVIYPMLNVGSTAVNYEPYTGLKPSPCPDYRQELVSPGDSGNVLVSITDGTENNVQTLNLSTPNGLPGIPVSTGGNYTDANGQQWICDEIDLARGIYIKRIGIKTFDGSNDEYWYSENPLLYTAMFRIGILDSVNAANVVGKDFVCTHFAPERIYGVDIEGAQHSGQQFYFRILKSSLSTADVAGFQKFLAASPVTLKYVLSVPVEKALAEEELAAYASLHTYRNNTTVSNDAGAYMELEYVMDAKKYIDRMLQPPAVRIVKVDLLASAWVGSGNLYSQVVSIDGVTKNTQVNLTPSVQQLSIFYEKDITFSTENDGGVITVYVIGQKPEHDYTIQASIVEVIT